MREGERRDGRGERQGIENFLNLFADFAHGGKYPHRELREI